MLFLQYQYLDSERGLSDISKNNFNIIIILIKDYI